MKDCTVGELFKIKIWNTLTYSLIFASEEKIREQSDKLQLFENGRSGYAERSMSKIASGRLRSSQLTVINKNKAAEQMANM
jgi:hypothetical protein